MDFEDIKAAFWNETVAFEVQAPLTDAMVGEKRERFCPSHSWISGDAFARIQVGHRSGDMPERWTAGRITFALQRGSDAVRIRLNEPIRCADASNEGTSASARECPRVTAVYELDKPIGLFAGLL